MGGSADGFFFPIAGTATMAEQTIAAAIAKRRRVEDIDKLTPAGEVLVDYQPWNVKKVAAFGRFGDKGNLLIDYRLS
jgi:hypothetical protein